MFFRPQKLSPEEQAIHDRCVRAARRFVDAQSELLEAVRAADRERLYVRCAEYTLTGTEPDKG